MLMSPEEIILKIIIIFLMFYNNNGKVFKKSVKNGVEKGDKNNENRAEDVGKMGETFLK